MRVETNLGKVEYQEHFAHLYERMAEVCQTLKNRGEWRADFPAPETIQNLPHYYQCLTAVRNHQEAAELLRIPAEEEYFEINANTREIVVPSHFNEYGLSVQGDHLAEIVYFRIPRFFDEMDLALCTKDYDPDAEYNGRCFIQWRLGDTGIPYETPAYAVEIADEYIVFGWVLSEQATLQAGELQFSARFVMFKGQDREKYTYSLSSTTAKCKILPGLDYDPGVARVDDYSNIVNTRPIYSNIVNSSFGAKPVIVAKGDLLTEAHLNAQGEYILTIKGYSPDNGTLSIRWFQDLHNDELNEVMVPEFVADEFGQLTKPNPALKVTAPTTAGEEYTFEYTTKEAGSYYGIISNLNNQGLIRSISSEVCVIPHASDFAIEEDIPTRVYSDGVRALNVVVTGANGADVAADEFNGVYYQWQIKNALNPDAEWEDVEGADKATWLPPVDTDGYIRCKITNKRNRDVHEKLTVMDCELRALPKAPQVAGIITTVDVAGNEGYGVNITDPDTRDLYYEWSDGYVSSKEKVFVINWNDSRYKSIPASKPYITLRCSVSRCIWPNDASKVQWSDPTTVEVQIKVGEYGINR